VADIFYKPDKTKRKSTNRTSMPGCILHSHHQDSTRGKRALNPINTSTPVFTVRCYARTIYAVKVWL